MNRQWALLVLLALVACTADPVTSHDNSPEAGRPNILLIVTDDQRDGTMSMMPDFERWFGAGGTRYENAFVTTPACCPARASILTGLYAHNHGIHTNRENESTRIDRNSIVIGVIRVFIFVRIRG